MSIPTVAGERARFLNVDLDIYSKVNLKALVSALGKDVFALYAGREGRLWSAHLELSETPTSADAAIRRFAALINSLPPAKRRLWDAAVTRDFNIGIQGGTRPRILEINLRPHTMKAVASLNARVAFTVYATELSSDITR